MSSSLDQDALRTVSTGIDKFATEFCVHLAYDEPNNNLICSPISVSMVLSMAMFGARDNTEKQIRTALHLSDNVTLNKRGIQFLVDNLNAVTKVELRLANKLFIDVNFKLLPEFEDLTKSTFQAASQNIDFGKTIEASRIINSWAEDNTNNRIKDIVQPDDLAAAPSLILINAVYFKGNWKKKFNPELTQLKTFYINKQTTKEVPMMRKRATYNYDIIAGIHAKYVELPYESDDAKDAISMFVILPDDKDGLSHVASNLHHLNFKELHDKNQSIELDLQMPKFKIESKLELENVLKKMGMTDMFEGSADFRGITGSPNLTVSRVVQKAFLEVNEEGSEAAAVTAMMMMRCCMPLPPMELIIDRPFICAIIATNTGTQLFTAHISDPTEA